MSNLYAKSITVLQENQAANGAFTACPSFPTYQYSWLRDGTFIAYALDRTGHHQAAKRFYQWVDTVIRGQAARIGRLVEKTADGSILFAEDFLPARYSFDGSALEDDWPNFQLDGYGAWLWGLAEHAALTNDYEFLTELNGSIRLTLDYLKLCWMLPCFDCWEEHGNQVHPSTLACLAGGIARIGQVTNDKAAIGLAAEIKRYFMRYAIKDGRLTKFCLDRPSGRSVSLTNARVNTPPLEAGGSVDASLLWASAPFGLLEPGDPVMVNTVQAIDRALLKAGGVHRYSLDTYYGGGPWILLTAWLGWYYSRAGRLEEARSCQTWIETQADADDFLPEQTAQNLNDPASYQPWVDQRGTIAKPLLWSHAMYLILCEESQKTVRGETAECI